MQTIKNLLNPGGKETDEVLYGQKDQLEGENFNAGRNTTSAGPGASSVGTAGNSGVDKKNLTGTATGLDDTTTGAGGVSQRDHATTTTGPHSSNLANRADPRVDTHQDTTRHTTASGLNQNPTTPRDATSLAQGNTATQSPSATAPSNPYSSKQVDPRLGGSNTQATPFPTSTTGQTESGHSNPASIEGSTHVPGGNTDRLSNPANTGNTSGSGHHLGRDTAVLGTGAAVGEGIHHHRDNERNLAGSSNDYPAGNTTSTSGGHSSNLATKADPRIDSDRDGSRTLGSNTNTGAYNTNPSTTGTTSTNTESGHHYGRDAAVLGTGAAVGEGIHHHRENERGLDTSTARDKVGNTSSDYGATTTGPLSGDRNTTGSDLTGTNTGTGHHGHEQGHSHSHGTEAAAGGAAAAALAGSRHDPSTKYSGTTPSGMSSSYYGGPKGTAVDGPHTTSTANRLDPHISDNKNLPPIEDASTHHPETGGGAESADLAHQDKSKLTGSQNATSKEQYLASTGSTEKDHHYGRDAGLAGVAVAGAGYETKRHHDNKHDVAGTSGLSNTTSTKDAAYGSSDLHGRHEGTSGLLGTSGVPTSTSTNDQGLTGTSHTTTGTSSTSPTSTGKDHKYGRDAALGTGAGVTGYEAKKHHDNTTTTSGASPTTSGKDHHDKHDAAIGTGASSADLGHTPHSSKILNVLDPRVKTTGIGATKEAKEAEALRTKSNESGTGQGSHLARDGAGVAAVGGVGYEAEKHQKKHESPISDSTATGHMDHHHGTTSTTGKDHHIARDVGGAGLVGGAGYEAEKAHHSHQTNTNKSLPSAPGNHGVGTGAGTQNALGAHTHDTTVSSRTPNVDRHYGRDAAVGGAGLSGAAALGEHEHNKHTHERGTDDKLEKSQHLGDHLHGVERNRGVPDASVMSSTSGINEKHSSGDHERNRLHKAPPASHPASGLTGAGTGYGDSPSGHGKTSSGTNSLSEGGNYGASSGTYSYGDQRAMPRSELNTSKGTTGSQHVVDGGVPEGKDARHGLVEQGEKNLDGQTGVSNAGEGVGKKF